MYVQNTPEDQAVMLGAIGLSSIEDLFQTIPEALRLKGDLDMPAGMPELDLRRLVASLTEKMKFVAPENRFLGAGMAAHFVPTVIDHVTINGDFFTAYTPYQAEASQGTLQAIFEFQTALCRLLQMDVANASMYCGATAFVEALLMACAAQKKRTEFVIAGAVHPEYLEVLNTYTQFTSCVVTVVPPGPDGRVDLGALREAIGDGTAAIALQQPNFLGVIEDAQAISDIAHEKGALVVAAVDPIATAVLTPPGEFGADIAVGEGQPLGIPVSAGGPSFGFFASREGQFKKKDGHIRGMPGRIVGETVDSDGKRAFCLVLQTREQHIRRAKATSNICTNQALMALRGLVFLSQLGKQGLVEMATQCATLAHYAADTLAAVDGYTRAYPDAPFFNEFVLKTPKPAAAIAKALSDRGILAGVPLSRVMPGREDELLVCVTELNTRESIDRLADALKQA